MGKTGRPPVQRQLHERRDSGRLPRGTRRVAGRAAKHRTGGRGAAGSCLAGHKHFSRNRSGGGDVRRPGGGHLPSGVAARHRCGARSLSVPHPLILADAATGGDFSISPDGRRLAFVAAAADGTRQLWIRPLDSLAAVPLAETEGAANPFWSPDSEFVAFFAQRRSKRSLPQADPCRSSLTRCCRAEARGTQKASSSLRSTPASSSIGSRRRVAR